MSNLLGIFERWEGKGRPPIYKMVQKESDWKTYYGSHQFIKDEIKSDKTAIKIRIVKNEVVERGKTD